MEELTKIDNAPPFAPPLQPHGAVKEKLKNLQTPLGSSVIGAVVGAGAFLGSQYLWSTPQAGSEQPTTQPPANVLQEQPLPHPNPNVGTADVCTHNLDSLSFGKAFAEAREECGAGAVFVWHGRAFNTYYREEWNGFTADQKHEFSVAVANLSQEIKEVIADNGYHMPQHEVHPLITHTHPHDHDTHTGHSTDGGSHFAIDGDGDGYRETVVFLDRHGKVEVTTIDTDHDGVAETRITDDRIIGIVHPTDIFSNGNDDNGNDSNGNDDNNGDNQPEESPEPESGPESETTPYDSGPDFDPNGQITDLV